MKHRVKKSKLNRKAEHRNSMLANLTVSLIIYEKVTTTKAKARELRSYFDKVINEAKKNTISSERNLRKMLHDNKLAVMKVLDVYVERFQSKNSGYTTRYIVNVRKGDASEMVQVQVLADKNKKKMKSNQDKNNKQDTKKDIKKDKNINESSETEKNKKTEKVSGKEKDKEAK